MIARRLILTALSIALLAALPSFVASYPPAFAQDKTEEPPKNTPPPEEPTKAPAPAEQEKTPTSVVGQEPTKTPTPFEAGKTPTGVASPTPVSTESAEPTSAPTEMPTSTPFPTPTPTEPALSGVEGTPAPVVQVIGMVFDDANGNGQRDPNEPGLVGVPVVVEDGSRQHTLITDAGGTYAAQVSPAALVKVIPPAGWRTPGLAVLPARDAGDFPLRRQEGAANAASFIALATATQSAVNLGGIAAGFVGLGVMVWIALLAHQRAIVRAYQQWALADLRLRHETERAARQFAVESDDQALALLNQAALDATGAQPVITHLVKSRTMLSPIAAIAAFSSRDSRHWFFSPVAPDRMRRLARDKTLAEALFGKSGWRGVEAHYAIDALDSGPFVADELAAALRYLAPDAASPLPHAEQWHMYVVTPRKKGDR